MTDQGATTQIIENKDLIKVSPKEVTRACSTPKIIQITLINPLELVKEGNTKFNVQFTTKDGRRLNTKDFYFSPQLNSKNGDQILSLKAAISPNQYLEFVYAIDAERFLVDFSIQSSGIVFYWIASLL